MTDREIIRTSKFLSLNLRHEPQQVGLTLDECGRGEVNAQENITVHEVPLTKAQGWLAPKAAEGLLIEPKVYEGLYFLGRRK
jgi:RNA:NAD 2'-phosphotransferase (TPT1/KptA family)